VNVVPQLSVAGLVTSMANKVELTPEEYIANFPSQTRDAVQAILHYDPKANFLNSPLARTLNFAFFPFRFNLKVSTFMARALQRQSALTQIGVIHGLAHLALVLALTWWFAHLNGLLGLQAPGHGRLWIQGALYIVEMIVIGGPLGAFLFSLALLPGVNFNEAYSAQRLEHYKNFLRIHLGPDGALLVYAVGIRRVARWRFDPRADRRKPYFRPRDGKPPRVHLIEDPFTVPAPVASSAASPGGPQASAEAWNTSTQ